MFWSVLPLVVTIALIAVASITELIGLNLPIVRFLGEAHRALFISLIVGYVVALLVLPSKKVSEALFNGLRQSIPMIILTGVNGLFKKQSVGPSAMS